MHSSAEILRPLKTRYVLLTLFVAILLEMLPLDSGAIQWQPDFVAVMILYWAINRPHSMGVFSAFALGVITDIASGALLGQHALSYSIIAYSISVRQRQIVMYSLGQQATIVFGLLILNQWLMMLARMSLGAPWFGWGYFVSPFLAALLWPALSTLLLLPQQRARVR